MSGVQDLFERLRAEVADAWRLARTGGDAEDVAAQYQRMQEAAAAVVRHDLREDRDVCGDAVAAELARLEEDARDFFQQTSMRASGVARSLALLRARGRLLRRVTRSVEGVALLDEAPFLLVELQEIENGIRFGRSGGGAAGDSSEPEPPAGELGEELAALRLLVVDAHAANELEASRDLVEATAANASHLFTLYRELRRTQGQLAVHVAASPRGAAAAAAATVDRVNAEADRLEQMFFEFADKATDASAIAALGETVRALTGELDEARLRAYESATQESVSELKTMQGLGEMLLRAYRKALRARGRDASASASAVVEEWRLMRRLWRMTGRIRNLVADQVLGLRLDRLLGRRFVRIWEGVIFWLIMAVLVLIVVDHHIEPAPPGVIGWTTWVDTAICAVLLGDFVLRLLLTPRRLSYFRRRLLTEFLPSIPFGLLADLEHVSAVRSLRLLRLARVFRVLRVLRPFIRMLRLLLFVARAVDRLVEKYAGLLNVNIVFFTDPVKDEGVPTLLKRARDIDAWVARSVVDLTNELPADVCLRAARWRCRFIKYELAWVGGGSTDGAVRLVAGEPGAARDLDVNDVIRALRDLNGNRIAEYVGLEFARQVTSSLRFFRLPFLRRLPVVRFVLGPTGVPDPLWTTARLGKVIGDFLDVVQRSVTWFADLYGSITGAQFLDRVGMQLIRSTARPAKRLVLFGAFFGLALLLVRMTRFEFLEVLANALFKFLSLPVLVLGLICLVPLLLGIWFRRIAGQAADFYDRVAEAQFLALTETAKDENARDYLVYLARRVMIPEARLLGTRDEDREKLMVERFCRRGETDPLARQPTGVDEETEWPGWSHCETLLLFHRSFLDGAFFHRNDTQIASLLLGNLTLENVRRKRLRYGKKQMKRLEKLDIGRGKGGMTGPYIWFNFITHSVAQLTARLIIEYNQHCIPLLDLPGAETIDRQLYEGWLEKRLALSRLESSGQLRPAEEPLVVSGAAGTLLYRTTEFNALHFLTLSPARDEMVRRRFGEQVFELMREDRRNLIRVIFGSYPMQVVPRERRTFNPYEFYGRHFSRGRVFVSPLVGAGFVLRMIGTLIRRVVVIIRDVLDPEARPLEVNIANASFDVARRKIHRMRRPVVLETVRLRAEFDLEYLGLALPGRERTELDGGELEHDLRVLNASELEWEEFRELKSRRHRQLRLLGRILRYSERQGRSLLAELVVSNPGLAGREALALRAAATAFACDHERVWSITSAYDELRDVLNRARRGPPARRRLRLPSLRGRELAARVVRCWDLLTRDRPALAADADLRRSFLDEVWHGPPRLKRHLAVLDCRLPVGADPYILAYEALLAVAEEPFSWTEQLVAVRSVQSLGMLDLKGYEEQIWRLGDYEADGREEAALPA